MRADRLLSILLLLQVHRRLTAEELAERLAVSRRTIYRDLDALSAAGVPVYAERGHGGGCALLDGYRMHVPGLSEAEVQALALATPAFDLAAYWSRSQRQFLEGIPRHPVHMRVSPDVLQGVEAVGTFATIEAQGEPDATGWRELSVAFQSEDMALAFAFRYVDGCEIVEPHALRERLATVAEAALARYVG